MSEIVAEYTVQTPAPQYREMTLSVAECHMVERVRQWHNQGVTRILIEFKDSRLTWSPVGRAEGKAAVNGHNGST